MLWLMEKNLFDQPVKSDMTYDNIQTLVTSQGDDCTTGCLADYPYFKEHYQLNAIDLCKQQTLNNNSKAVQ